MFVALPPWAISQAKLKEKVIGLDSMWLCEVAEGTHMILKSSEFVSTPL